MKMQSYLRSFLAALSLSALGATPAVAGAAEAIAARFAGAAVDAGIDAVKSRVPLGGWSAPASTQAGPTSQKACPQFFPPGSADLAGTLDPRWRVTVLCSSSFAVVHSALTKTPILAVERLNAAILEDAKGEQRSEEFYPDDRIPRGQRAELNDYAGSALDRGHLAAAADAPTARAMHESFALSNMIPQDPTHNRKVWSKVESDTRRYVRRALGDVYVLTGPVFRGAPRVVGRSRVWVPSHLFKLVYDQTTKRSWVYLQPNSSVAQMGPPIAYEQFVREVGLDLLAGVARSD